jgi:hypothetical protein
MAKLFRKWNDLNQFHEVRKNLNYPKIWQCLKDNDSQIAFGLKIKLHGTNACVRVESDGNVVAQKRSSDVTTGHFGFASWAEEHEDYFSSLAKSDATVYVYGEWAGPGIQKGVAVSMTDRKLFYVFSYDEVYEDGRSSRFYDPKKIEEKLGVEALDDIIVVPWFQKAATIIDLTDLKDIELTMLRLNKMVEEIGEKDPLINDLFGLEGAGEGVVAYPLMGREAGIYHEDEHYFSYFNFKAKSEAHRVNKTKTAVQFDAEKFAGVQAFADFYVTENRLLQGLRESVNDELDMKRTPHFIKWVVSDIWKESSTERDANPDLDWKACSKACSTRAVLWYKKKVMG